MASQREEADSCFRMRQRTPNADGHIERIIRNMPKVVEDLAEISDVEEGKRIYSLTLGFDSWLDFTAWLRADDLRADFYMREMEEHDHALQELRDEGQLTDEEFSAQQHRTFLRGYRAGFEDAWGTGKIEI